MAEPGVVLVVDDHALSRELARAVLEGAGWRVEEAVTAGEAIARLQGGRFAAVVLDWHLKGADGRSVLQALEARAGDPAGPRVVVVTADARPEVDEAARAAGAQAVLTKPYLPGQLREVLGLPGGRGCPREVGEGGQGAGGG
jgi:CheY-like chemotaxis protein